MTFRTLSRMVCCVFPRHSPPLSAVSVRASVRPCVRASVRACVRASVRPCVRPQRILDPLQSPRTAVFRSQNYPIFHDSPNRPKNRHHTVVIDLQNVDPQTSHLAHPVNTAPSGSKNRYYWLVIRARSACAGGRKPPPSLFLLPPVTGGRGEYEHAGCGAGLYCLVPIVTSLLRTTWL